MLFFGQFWPPSHKVSHRPEPCRHSYPSMEIKVKIAEVSFCTTCIYHCPKISVIGSTSILQSRSAKIDIVDVPWTRVVYGLDRLVGQIDVIICNGNFKHLDLKIWTLQCSICWWFNLPSDASQPPKFSLTPTGLVKNSQKYIADPTLVLPQIEYWNFVVYTYSHTQEIHAMHNPLNYRSESVFRFSRKARRERTCWFISGRINFCRSISRPIVETENLKVNPTLLAAIGAWSRYSACWIWGLVRLPRPPHSALSTEDFLRNSDVVLEWNIHLTGRFYDTMGWNQGSRQLRAVPLDFLGPQILYTSDVFKLITKRGFRIHGYAVRQIRPLLRFRYSILGRFDQLLWNVQSWMNSNDC